jgi:hypothetical protein
MADAAVLTVDGSIAEFGALETSTNEDGLHAVVRAMHSAAIGKAMGMADRRTQRNESVMIKARG